MVEQLWGDDLMGKQRTFASEAWSRKGKVTRRERFLAETDQVIPWDGLRSLIEPHYHAPSGRGRKPHDLERMLRIYFLQQWFNLSDPQAEDVIYDSESMRRFAGVELGEDRIPDESTILRFRHLLEALVEVVTRAGQSEGRRALLAAQQGRSLFRAVAPSQDALEGVEGAVKEGRQVAGVPRPQGQSGIGAPGSVNRFTSGMPPA